MKIDIKNWVSGEVIFSHDQENNSLKITLEKAVRERADLTRADLAEANLSGADLFKADLFKANLFKANLTGADLTGADLTRADLRRADLTGANLFKANLFKANLTGTNLTGTNLTGTNLMGANLMGANLTLARYGEASLTKGFLQLTGLNWSVCFFDEHIKIGCKLFKTEEWREFTDEEIDAMDVEALEFWRKNKSVILSIAKGHQHFS